MKTSTETVAHCDIEPTSTAAPSARPARSTGLKLAIAITSVAALCLSYQAASQAVTLCQVLDEVQAALSTEQTAIAAAVASPTLSETNHRVAGL